LEIGAFEAVGLGFVTTVGHTETRFIGRARLKRLYASESL